MTTFSPLDLIRSHPWSQSFFTSYALSLSFFEAVVLDALVRQNVERTLILADIGGVRTALAEYGSRCAGRVYDVEPVAVAQGCFHPKLLLLTSATETHLVVSSGNLTFGGWGGNLECIEHLYSDIAADAFEDAADFLESLATARNVKHEAGETCAALAEDLRRRIMGQARSGSIRLLHSLDRAILDQLIEISDDLGGAERLTVASPFHDGAALDQLCQGLALDHVFVHSHDGGTAAGSVGLNWPVKVSAKVDAVELDFLGGDGRPLHAKAFEIVCRRGRVLLSGSANATMAALARERNVEMCVARIQRDSSTKWGFTPSSAPPVAEVIEDEHKIQAMEEGVLRAVLAGDEVRGRILTPFPSGKAMVCRVTASGPISVGEASVTADGQFTVAAKEVERDAWTAHRLIIRVTSITGTMASGFVSFAEFAEIKRHLGNASSRLFAMLAGTETPDDIAAVMSWFHEHPEYLAVPSGTGGGGSTHLRPGSQEISVSALLNPHAVIVPSSNESDLSNAPGWRRFVELILASFREPRGPITDEDDPARDAEAPPEDDQPDENGSKPQRPAVSFERLSLFEALLTRMLEGSPVKRSHGFWFAHYFCDRLEVDAVQVRRYLGKVMAAFGDGSPLEADRSAVAAAALVWVTQMPFIGDAISLARVTRRRLLRMGIDVAEPAPDMKPVQGFVRALAPDCDFAEFWQRIREVRTPQEEVSSLRLAHPAPILGADFPYLAATPELSALTSSDRKRMKFMTRYSEFCPCCHISLPGAQASRLREAGVGRALNCCGRILLCEEI